MSRRAAESGFVDFLEPTVDAIRQEFSVGRALRGTGLGAGGHVLDQLRSNADDLERRLVEPELATYREQSIEQFRVLLDAVESDEPIAAYEDQLLAHDTYVEALDPAVSADQRAAVVDAILGRLERLGTGIEPLVDRPEDEFWAATEAAFDRTGALRLVEDAFPFTGPLQTHGELFIFEARVDPNEILDSPFLPTLPSVTIDYTDEATRAMTRAEQRTIRALKREVQSRFESAN